MAVVVVCGRGCGGDGLRAKGIKEMEKKKSKRKKGIKEKAGVIRVR